MNEWKCKLGHIIRVREPVPQLEPPWPLLPWWQDSCHKNRVQRVPRREKVHTKSRILNLKITQINLRWKWQNKIHYETCAFVHSASHKQVLNGGSITGMPPCSRTPKGIPGNQTSAISHLTSGGMVLSPTYIDRILSRQETKLTLFLIVQNPAGCWNQRAVICRAEIWRQTDKKAKLLDFWKKYIRTEQKIFKI